MKQKLSLFVAFACICGGGGGYNAQAQLYVDIFPSQDDTNATLWVFSGSSRSGVTIANVFPYISTSGGYNRRDTHKTGSAFLQDPTSLTPAANYNLTPLFTATATNAAKDLESLRTRLGQTIKLGTTNTNDDITIPSSATNVPTLTFTGVGSRTIAAMHLRNVQNTGWDDIGPRVSGSNFQYGTGQPNVNWIGAGIMTNKPIAHFHITAPGTYIGNRPGNGILKSWTDHTANNGLRIRVYSSVIPEPEEYALVFGLFALAFVFFHRRMMQKKRKAAATS